MKGSLLKPHSFHILSTDSRPPLFTSLKRSWISWLTRSVPSARGAIIRRKHFISFDSLALQWFTSCSAQSNREWIMLKKNNISHITVQSIPQKCSKCTGLTKAGFDYIWKSTVFESKRYWMVPCNNVWARKCVVHSQYIARKNAGINMTHPPKTHLNLGRSFRCRRQCRLLRGWRRRCRLVRGMDFEGLLVNGWASMQIYISEKVISKRLN